ncbi:MAG: phosphoglycerate dehydrogenase [Elusimicrobia bacterium]|nr:phosphoglycerate dehydrogenase [Elusimicrobiota bacterium]
MSRPVLVTTSSFGAGDPAPREALERAGLEIHLNPHGRKLTEAEIQGLLQERRPAGLIAGLEPLTGRVLESARTHLKVISRCGVGLDNVDQDAAKRLGIRVYSTPEAPSEAVAELAIALILSCLRRVAEADRALRAGQWKQLQGALLGGKTVALLGYGRIGRRVGTILKAFGCRLLVHDPFVKAEPGVELVGLEAALEVADVVSVHAPLTPETRGLLSRERLAKLRRGAIVVNTSRGGLVDEAALAEALKSGAVGGAGIDVFEREPYDGPLKECATAVLTPHMGSAAKECRLRMESEAARNLIDGLKAEGLL